MAVWDPKKHLRDPLGRFRSMSLEPGWHEYRRGSEIKQYYINDMRQLADGSNILHMSAQGRVTGTARDSEPIERIHIVGTDEGEQMAIAASGQTTFGVINHDKPAPPETFSLNRGHEFQPVAHGLPEHETAFGGTLEQLSGRKDGRVYDTLNARKAEQANRDAFDDPKARVYSVDPQELAERAKDARKYYEREFGLGEATAREMPVYVYMDRKGNVNVTPVYKPVRDEDGTIQMRKLRSPNTHGGGGSVKLTGSDVTRMSRAMQQDGLDRVDMTISGGTNLNRNGKPLRNALHVRKLYRNPDSGDYATVWGTIETKNKGVSQVQATGSSESQQSKLEYLKQTREVREHAARKYENPQDPATAAKLMRVKYGNRTYSSDVTMTPGSKDGTAFVIRSANGHLSQKVNAQGRPIGLVANDGEGFAALYNRGKGLDVRIGQEDAQRLYDGNFRVLRSDSSIGYYAPDGSPTRGVFQRDGESYTYGPDGHPLRVTRS